MIGAGPHRERGGVSAHATALIRPAFKVCRTAGGCYEQSAALQGHTSRGRTVVAASTVREAELAATVLPQRTTHHALAKRRYDRPRVAKSRSAKAIAAAAISVVPVRPDLKVLSNGRLVWAGGIVGSLRMRRPWPTEVSHCHGLLGRPTSSAGPGWGPCRIRFLTRGFRHARTPKRSTAPQGGMPCDGDY